jgi:hypothetical protein
LPIALHEARVREFLAAAQVADPERSAATCARYPVKSKRQLRRIAETEITAGLQPVSLRRLPKPKHSLDLVTERKFVVVEGVA